MRNTFSRVWERVEDVKLRELFIPLIGLLLISGAVLYTGSTNRSGQNNPGQTGLTPIPTRPLSIGFFVPFIPRTFKIVLEFDLASKNLALKELSVISDTINTDSSLASRSPYEVALLDKANTSLYKTKVIVHEFMYYDIAPGQNRGPYIANLPKKLPTYIYLPYYSGASKFVIYKDGNAIFSTDIAQVGSAQKSPVAKSAAGDCGPKTIAIIGDGFPSPNAFHAKANEFISNLSGTTSYGGTNNLFNFQIYDSSDSTTCSQGIISCLGNSAVYNAVQRARAQTGAVGAVVLVNGGGRSAVALLGEGPAVLNTLDPGWPSIFIDRHEFLGHMIGSLYDRYSYSDEPIQQGIKNNCTDSPSGEAFWSHAGSSGAYPGCSSSNTYAPFPNTCGTSGNPDTMMGGCVANANNPQFDQVEDYWIKHNILPELTCSAPPPDSGASGGSGGGGGGGGAGSCPSVSFMDWQTGAILGNFTGSDGQQICSNHQNLICTNGQWQQDLTRNWVCGNGSSGGGGGGGGTGGGGGGGGTTTYSATISWPPMPDATGGYEVDFVAGSTNTGVVTTGGTSYTFAGLAQGSYSWTIWALDDTGNKTGNNEGTGKAVGY